MAGKYISCELNQIIVGEPLPCDVFLFISYHFITYRLAGDPITRDEFGRFEIKNLKTLFIHAKDEKKFDEWSARTREAVGLEPITAKAPAAPASKTTAAPAPVAASGAMLPEIATAREEVRRKAMDIFQSGHPDKAIAATLTVSKSLVDEVMKHPYAVKSLSQLHTFSQGTVDHSVNISVLSVYLAMQMGYSHAIILQHVGTGALLHDIGKTQVKVNDEDSPKVIAKKMRAHPELGAKMLEQQQNVPNEVKMIVAQHHENHDGTGYPRKLKGSQIYDLTKIVSIANVFDELVTSASGSLSDRQKHALKQLDTVEYLRFDPQKLEKSLKILRLGI